MRCSRIVLVCRRPGNVELTIPILPRTHMMGPAKLGTTTVNMSMPRRTVTSGNRSRNSLANRRGGRRSMAKPGSERREDGLADPWCPLQFSVRLLGRSGSRCACVAKHSRIAPQPILADPRPRARILTSAFHPNLPSRIEPLRTLAPIRSTLRICL
jgi:hypothetical protein